MSTGSPAFCATSSSCAEIMVPQMVWFSSGGVPATQIGRIGWSRKLSAWTWNSGCGLPVGKE